MWRLNLKSPTYIPFRTQSPVWIFIVTPTKLLLLCLFSQRKSRAFLAYSYNKKKKSILEELHIFAKQKSRAHSILLGLSKIPKMTTYTLNFLTSKKYWLFQPNESLERMTLKMLFSANDLTLRPSLSIYSCSTGPHLHTGIIEIKTVGIY